MTMLNEYDDLYYGSDDTDIDNNNDDNNNDDNNNDTSNNQNTKISSPSVLITAKHIAASLKEMRPSVSIRERARYAKMYSQFAKSRDANFEGNFAEHKKKMRTALK